MYLLDTNIFIRAYKGSDKEAKFLEKIIEENSLAISVIVIAEFSVKAEEAEKISFDRLFTQFKILKIDQKTAEIAASYRKQFLRKTKKVYLDDCFLAAQAKINKLTLVTSNKADFPMTDIKIQVI